MTMKRTALFLGEEQLKKLQALSREDRRSGGKTHPQGD